MWTDWGWLWPAVAASALISIALVPLGHHVLARGMVFADLAIAQWAALGILLAGNVFPDAGQLARLVGSLLLALTAVSAVSLVLRSMVRHREAMIGLLYAVGASAATLLVSNDPHGAQRLTTTLDGDLLWTTALNLWPLAALAVSMLWWQFRLPERWADRLFLPLFAVAITLTVELAGIYVVFTSLIAAPLLLTYLCGTGVVLAILVCLAGHGLGLLASAWQDLPTGPTVVITTLIVSVILAIFSQRRVIRDAWLPP
ncbi:metal ABC transporter permease [Marinobacter halophilus]|uniref:ABC transporter n=1 Tax=Marinobacter halophilus TaxID=1323740 RepID=A0A2T1KJF6_9GAMM|nr:metal ABC transporter permease [Marinobacter halophilus]PSF10215.1 ABC transporter [Marinobacter halophilus]GGC68707.1 ABC transporter [Marinobacter halophilus]